MEIGFTAIRICSCSRLGRSAHTRDYGSCFKYKPEDSSAEKGIYGDENNYLVYMLLYYPYRQGIISLRAEHIGDKADWS